jgi:hypothetical protein
MFSLNLPPNTVTETNPTIFGMGCEVPGRSQPSVHNLLLGFIREINHLQNIFS